MRILVTDGMDKAALAQLKANGHEVVEQFYEPDQLGEALRDFDAVIIRSATKIKEPQIDAAKDSRLKLIIRAGVQKHVGPAGMSIAIIREDLLREDLPDFVPTYLRYKTHADAGSLYNTPNCWAIYCCGKVFKYLLKNGGLAAMAARNEEKAAVLYDFLDQSRFFTGAVRKEDRSLMNVPFVSPSKEQDADVVAASKAAGFDNLKGHKSVGGLRASIYNAMPKEGVEALVRFLKKYEAENA